MIKNQLTTDEWFEWFGISLEKHPKLLNGKDIMSKDQMEKPLINFPYKLERKITPDSQRDQFFLTFDSGLRYAAEAAQKTLIARKKHCNEAEKQGWAGQFAFDSYLEEIGIPRTHDNPLYSPDADDSDFFVHIKGSDSS